jgi:replicative DNA helicase
MTKQNLIHRMMCSNAKVPYTRFRHGRVGQEERERLIGALSGIMELPLQMDETSSITIAELQTRAEKMVAKQGVKVLLIDYIQIMNKYDSGDGRRYRDENEMLTNTSNSLRAIAKDLNVPVIYLSQFSRAKRARVKSDLRPKLSDLHGSSSLEKDAAVIMSIYREELDFPTRPELKGLAELIILKNRNGMTKTIKMKFNRLYTLFEEEEATAPDHES